MTTGSGPSNSSNRDFAMPSDSLQPATPAAHRQFVAQVEAWLRPLTSENAELAAQVAVDLADRFHAAAEARLHLNTLLSRNPLTAEDSETALQAATNVEVQLLVEMREHLTSLAVHWPAVIESLEASTSSARRQ